MIIDTHCHYNLSPLNEQWQEQWELAKQHSVIGSIVVGTSLESSTEAVNLATQNPAFYASVGIHPNEYLSANSPAEFLLEVEQEMEALRALLSANKVVALGECGLDYYRLPSHDSTESIIDMQKAVLTQQMRLAKEFNLPLIIHLRDRTERAYNDFLALYKAEGPFTMPFILHCVSGPLDFIQECIALGAYIGVAGNVTYPNSEKIRQIIKNAHNNIIVVETDAPFLPPQEARGRICEPWMIQWTADYLKIEFGLDYLDLTNNTVSLFPQFKNLL